MVQRQPDERFLTAVCAILRPDQDGFTGLITTAGHPSALIHRADGTVESLRTSGTLLGMFEDADLGQVRFSLRPGDALVLYSDGVTEAHAANNWDLFGEERLIALIAKVVDAEADALVKSISEAVLVYSNGHMIDDMAILVLRVLPSGETTEGR
ncbi:hypothetical protein GCM10023193_50480 [Planotetraspora kaengkrachanensis]